MISFACIMNKLRQARSKLKLITFDVTGTLLSFKRPVGEQYAEAGFKYDIYVDSDLLSQRFSKLWKQMNHDYPNYGFSCGMGWESWWHQLVHQTFINAAPSMKLDEENLKKVSHYLTDLFKGNECWQLCDGALDILEELKKSGMPIGVISNFDPRLEEILINMKIRDYFKFIIASYSAGIQKPNTKIFELAASLNNDKNLKGYEILHVGNSPTLDVQAALKAGWNACLVDFNEYHPINDDPSDVCLKHSNKVFHITVSSLHELKTLLSS